MSYYSKRFPTSLETTIAAGPRLSALASVRESRLRNVAQRVVPYRFFLPPCAFSPSALSPSLFPSRGIKFDTDLADLASFVPRPKTDSTRIQVGYLTNDIFEEFGDLGKRVSRFISTTIILPARGPPLLKKRAVFLEKMTEFKQEESILWLHLREGGEGVRSMASTDSKCVCVRVVVFGVVGK